MRRVLPLVALAVAVILPLQARAIPLFGGDQGAPPTPLKVTVIPVAGAPISLEKVTASRDGDGNLTVTAVYHSVGDKPITAVRIRFAVFDPFGGQIGYFNGVSQTPLAPQKTANMSWSGDQPYPIAGAIAARVIDVAFSDGTYWQAPDVPNPVIAAEHERLLRIYKDGGLKALLKALNE